VINFSAKLKAWKHKMFHFFTFCELIFNAVASEEHCLTVPAVPFVLRYIDRQDSTVLPAF